MVCLPTGLGKTLVAAVVMYNYYRWFPGGKVIFMAPTRPLVSQQHKACIDIMKIPESHTVVLEGSISREKRASKYSKRVIFCTPQTLLNDLQSGILSIPSIVCLVFDEAHRATHGYAYTQIILEMTKTSSCPHYRVLALSATPGSDTKKIQSVITNLQISHVEIRTEDDPDVAPYVHAKDIEIVRCNHPAAMASSLPQYLRAVLQSTLQHFIDILYHDGILMHNDVTMISKSIVEEVQKMWKAIMQEDALPLEREILDQRFSLLHMLLQVKRVYCQDDDALQCAQLLQGYLPMMARGLAIGAVDSYGYGLMEGLKEAMESATKDPAFLLKRLPKIETLKEILQSELGADKDSNARDKKRILVFVHLRSTVFEILRSLQSLSMVRAREFIGQQKVPTVPITSSSASGLAPSTQSLVQMTLSGEKVVPAVPTVITTGLSQAEQMNILNKFNNRVYNVLVATSIAEEGLDISEVDLIIFFDSVQSPIRYIQRCGRTGRHKEGRIVIIQSGSSGGLESGGAEGVEEEKLLSNTDTLNKVNHVLRQALYSLRLCPHRGHPAWDGEEVPQVEYRAMAGLPISTLTTATIPSWSATLSPNYPLSNSAAKSPGKLEDVIDLSEGDPFAFEVVDIASDVAPTAIAPAWAPAPIPAPVVASNFAPTSSASSLTAGPVSQPLLLPGPELTPEYPARVSPPLPPAIDPAPVLSPTAAPDTVKPTISLSRDEGKPSGTTRTMSAPAKIAGRTVFQATVQLKATGGRPVAPVKTGGASTSNTAAPSENTRPPNAREVAKVKIAQLQRVVVRGATATNHRPVPRIEEPSTACAATSPSTESTVEAAIATAAVPMETKQELPDKVIDFSAFAFDYEAELPVLQTTTKVERKLQETAPPKLAMPAVPARTGGLLQRVRVLASSAALKRQSDEDDFFAAMEVGADTTPINQPAASEKPALPPATRPPPLSLHPRAAAAAAAAAEVVDLLGSSDDEPSHPEATSKSSSLVTTNAAVGSTTLGNYAFQVLPTEEGAIRCVVCLDHPAAHGEDVWSDSEVEHEEEEEEEEQHDEDESWWLRCRDCRATVHAACYGVADVLRGFLAGSTITVPPGRRKHFLFSCEGCQEKSQPPPLCMLCAKPGGALKAVANMAQPRLPNKRAYAHSICALFTPELHLDESMRCANPNAIDRERSALRCRLCGERGGAVVQCAAARCLVAYHPWCALQGDIYLVALDQSCRHRVRESIESQHECVEEEDEEEGEGENFSYQMYCADHELASRFVRGMRLSSSRPRRDELPIASRPSKRASIATSSPLPQREVVTLDADEVGAEEEEDQLFQPTQLHSTSVGIKTKRKRLRKAQESADEPQGRRRQRRSKTTGLDRFFVDEAELSGSASSDEEVGGVDADEDEEVLSGDFIDNRASALTQRTPPTPSFYRAVAMREEEEAQCGEGLGEEKDLFFLVNGRTRRSRAVVDTPDRPEDCWPDSAVRAIAPAAPAASWASHRPPRPPTAAPRRLGANHSSAPTSFRALLSSRSTPTDDDDEFLL